MKHQITFIGGQLLPILIGIKELKPESVHLVVSEESRNKVEYIIPFLSGMIYSTIICNPFDFFSIKEACEKILSKIQHEDEVHFNLTGGTKIMVLAAQALILERQLTGFYINQDQTLLIVPSYKIQSLTSSISIREFIEISGHKLASSKTLADYSQADMNTVSEIAKFTLTYDRLFLSINSKVRRTFESIDNLPSNGELDISKSLKLTWDKSSISVATSGREILRIQSPNVKGLFFKAVWWELLIAREISKWKKAKELLIQCELPFRSNTQIMKNEIDILINLGGKLIFVECKSGFIKQEDINKIRVVRDTYGGVVSKSILVCRFSPSTTILEKCKELNIEVFHSFEGNKKVNSLHMLIGKLDMLERRLSI